MGNIYMYIYTSNNEEEKREDNVLTFLLKAFRRKSSTVRIFCSNTHFF